MQHVTLPVRPTQAGRDIIDSKSELMRQEEVLASAKEAARKQALKLIRVFLDVDYPQLRENGFICAPIQYAYSEADKKQVLVDIEENDLIPYSVQRVYLQVAKDKGIDMRDLGALMERDVSEAISDALNEILPTR